MNRLLVVEDSPTQAAHIQFILESANYEVEVAPDGLRALAVLEERSFDLILSDVNMPELSGYELCARVKASPKLQRLPVILLTSRGDPMAIARGLECGADNFLTKPYDPEYLVERVRSIIEGQKTKRRLSVGVDLNVLGRHFVITSEKEQILDLLISTFEEVVRTNGELEARTEELNSILENIGDGVAVCDLRGKIIRYNEAATRLLGEPGNFPTMDAWFNASHLYTLDRVTPFPAEDFPTVAARAGATADECEMVVCDSSGNCTATIAMNARPLLNGAGQTRGVVVVIRDISQRKAAELLLADQALELSRAKDRAEQESRYKSRFLANMSHELRTPLNAILGFSDLLGQELFGPLNARQKQYVGYVSQSGEHLLALVNDILDLSKIEANKLDIMREWIEPLSVIRAAQGIVQPIADRKGVMVVLDVGETLPSIFVDPLRLKQILYNLLSNGVKFTPRGGTVTLRAQRAEGLFQLAVEDTGIGIAPENMQRLFQEFEQIEQALGQKNEGTGLGLALTRRLVEMHEGTICAQSEFGHGSTFTVVLPLMLGAERACAGESIRPDSTP